MRGGICPHRCYSKANMVRAFDSSLRMIPEFVYRGGSTANTGKAAIAEGMTMDEAIVKYQTMADIP